jgi:hypothetical protein
MGALKGERDVRLWQTRIQEKSAFCEGLAVADSYPINSNSGFGGDVRVLRAFTFTLARLTGTTP